MNKVFMPYFILQDLNACIGKLPFTTYDEFELIKAKKQKLIDNIKFLAESVEQEKIWQSNTQISQKTFAWISVEKFKNNIASTLLNIDQVLLIEYWCVIKSE